MPLPAFSLMPTSPLSLPPIQPTEDFWFRQHNSQKFSFEFAPLGIPTEITANDPVALLAAQLSSQRFSRVIQPSGHSIRLQIIKRHGFSDPLPKKFISSLAYSGLNDWITLSAGDWGQAFGQLQMRLALITVAPTLISETRLFSRYFIDHYLLNFLFTEWAMLHASAVLDPSGQHLFMFVGPHNAGKSTTALHLLRAGYHFLADGMVLLKLRPNQILAGGYPIGEVKLRDDVLALFPEYAGERVVVREHTKTVVDLRVTHPNQLAELLVSPQHVHLCFIEQGTEVALSPLDKQAAFDLIASQTVYWNTPSRLQINTSILHTALNTASLHRFTIGPQATDIVTALNTLL